MGSFWKFRQAQQDPVSNALPVEKPAEFQSREPLNRLPNSLWLQNEQVFTMFTLVLRQIQMISAANWRWSGANVCKTWWYKGRKRDATVEEMDATYALFGSYWKSFRTGNLLLQRNFNGRRTLDDFLLIMKITKWQHIHVLDTFGIRAK